MTVTSAEVLFQVCPKCSLVFGERKDRCRSCHSPLAPLPGVKKLVEAERIARSGRMRREEFSSGAEQHCLCPGGEEMDPFSKPDKTFGDTCPGYWFERQEDETPIRIHCTCIVHHEPREVN